MSTAICSVQGWGTIATVDDARENCVCVCVCVCVCAGEGASKPASEVRTWILHVHMRVWVWVDGRVVCKKRTIVIRQRHGQSMRRPS